MIVKLIVVIVGDVAARLVNSSSSCKMSLWRLLIAFSFYTVGIHSLCKTIHQSF
ncbi:hypothetical protein A4U88_3932 [Serratia marcescens]|nr:hypothetical protein A4U88_3932 [Serratia marcescens]